MTDEMYDLIDRLTDLTVKELLLDQRFVKALHRASEAERTEIAYRIEDAFWSHPERPECCNVSMARIEQFIATRLKLAEWHVTQSELDDEFDALMESMRAEVLLSFPEDSGEDEDDL